VTADAAIVRSLRSPRPHRRHDDQAALADGLDRVFDPGKRVAGAVVAPWRPRTDARLPGALQCERRAGRLGGHIAGERATRTTYFR